MKKQLITVLQAFKNTLSGELSDKIKSDLTKALEDAIKAAQDSPDEITEEQIKKMITDNFAGATKEEVAAVKNALEEQMKRHLKNSPENKYLESKKAMKDFFNAITSGDSVAFKNNWNKSLKENGIEIKNDIDSGGVLLPAPVVKEIIDGLSKAGNLFPLLNHTGLKSIRIPVNALVEDDDTSRAARHTKGQSKAVQTWSLTAKNIVAQAIFKLLPVDYETIRQVDNEAALLRYISKELVGRWVREIERCILVGDGRSSGVRKVTSFEAIGKSTTDAYTTVIAGAEDQTLPTIENCKSLVDAIESDGRIVLVMSKVSFSNISKYIMATGGTTQYRSKEEIAGQLGVDRIIVDRNVTYTKGFLALAFDVDAYLVVGDTTPESIYQYDIHYNQHNYEMIGLAGGGLGQLLSSSCLKYTNES